MSDMDLSLVIPVFNEEDNLEELIERCIGICETMEKTYELVFVDDGSRDASRTI